MTSFDEIADMLDDIADEVPTEFFRELNGGINLLPDRKIHPEAREYDDLFILGEYHHDSHGLGRYINIYYGSFMEIYAQCRPDRQREKLKDILLHEFTHHIESLAGEKGLEIKDMHDMIRYRQTRRERSNHQGS